jgi:hypothetical protein
MPTTVSHAVMHPSPSFVLLPPRTGLHRQKRDSTVFDSAFHRQAGRRFAHGVRRPATEERLRHGGAAVHVPPHGFRVVARPRNRVSYARSFAGALRGRRGNTGRIAPLWLPPQL